MGEYNLPEEEKIDSATEEQIEIMRLRKNIEMLIKEMNVMSDDIANIRANAPKSFGERYYDSTDEKRLLMIAAIVYSYPKEDNTLLTERIVECFDSVIEYLDKNKEYMEE